MISTLVIYLLLGAGAGLLAGLFGVGGGVIIVPVLIYSFEHQGMSPQWLTHIAVGTSLAVICISSLGSIYAHQKKQYIVWPAVRQLTPGLMLGVMLGALLITRVSGAGLQWIIGIYLLLIACQMAFNLMPQRESVLPSSAVVTTAGGVIGFVSAFFGIGGGSLTVPFLSFYGVRMQQAVATSSACGLPIALIGALTNIIHGWGSQELPEWSLGYIYLPAFIGIALLSAPFAKVGAQLAQAISALVLKRLFAVFLAIIGVSLIIKSVGYS